MCPCSKLLTQYFPRQRTSSSAIPGRYHRHHPRSAGAGTKLREDKQAVQEASSAVRCRGGLNRALSLSASQPPPPALAPFCPAPPPQDRRAAPVHSAGTHSHRLFPSAPPPHSLLLRDAASYQSHLPAEGRAGGCITAKRPPQWSWR